MTILPYALGICLIAVTIFNVAVPNSFNYRPINCRPTISTRYTLFKCNLHHYYFRHLLGQHFII